MFNILALLSAPLARNASAAAAEAGAVAVPVYESPAQPLPPDPLPEKTVPAALPGSATVQKVWIWQESRDCLWNMAREHYGNPFLWPRIYEANRDVIRDPHVIFPKQRLRIPPSEGTP